MTPALQPATVPGDDSITHYKVLRRNPAGDDVGDFDTIKENTALTDTASRIKANYSALAHW